MEDKELVAEIINTLALANTARFFNIFHVYLKGESFLLNLLLENGGESTPGELSSMLNVSAARITAILRSLEHKKYIERVLGKADRRSVFVRLTDSGRQYTNQIRDDAVYHATQVLKKLGKDDSLELVRILKKVIEIEGGIQNDPEKNNQNLS